MRIICAPDGLPCSTLVTYYVWPTEIFLTNVAFEQVALLLRIRVQISVRRLAILSCLRFSQSLLSNAKVKVKISLYRPWRRLGLREIKAPTFCLDNRFTDGGEVVSPTRRPLFTPRKIPGTHFCYRLSRPQGHSGTGRIRLQMLK
jgi:hypothetical protein